MSEPLPPHPIYDPLRDLPAFFRIRTKDKRWLPFHPNRMQREYYTKKTRRNIIVKARQLGTSMGELADNVARAVQTPGTNMVIIAQDLDLGRALMNQCQVWLEELRPVGLLPTVGKWNENEVTFPLMKSAIFLETAQGRSPGRGRTMHLVHCTEVSHWNDAAEVMAAISASVPPNGIITVESTPNGAGGWFYEEYSAAKRGESLDGSPESIYTPFFFPWWYGDEYRRPVNDKKAFEKTLNSDEKRLLAEHELDFEQIQFRREEMKQSERSGGLFLQEYPEDDISCFLTAGANVFDPQSLERMRADIRRPIEFDPDSSLRIWKLPSLGKRYVIGSDTAEGIGRPGKDADYSTAIVVDIQSLEHVATMHTNRMAPEIFAEKLAELGKRYNEAYIAVERRSSGYAINRILSDDLGYPMLHVERDPEHPTRFDPFRTGLMMSEKIKPDVIRKFSEAIRTGDFLTHDDALLREIGNYVYEDAPGRGYKKAGAVQGHDDLVMAAMIAVYVKDDAPYPRSARSGPVHLLAS